MVKEKGLKGRNSWWWTCNFYALHVLRAHTASAWYRFWWRDRGSCRQGWFNTDHSPNLRRSKSFLSILWHGSIAHLSHVLVKGEADIITSIVKYSTTLLFYKNLHPFNAPLIITLSLISFYSHLKNSWLFLEFKFLPEHTCILAVVGLLFTFTFYCRNV